MTLASSKITLNDIAASSPVGILVINSSEEVVYANQSAEKVFQKSIPDTEIVKCGDFLSCANKEETEAGCGHSSKCPKCPLLNAIRSTFSAKGQQETSGETRVDRADNLDSIWVKFQARKTKIDQQDFLILTVDDISDRKETEERLQKRTVELENIRQTLIEHDELLVQAMAAGALGAWFFDVASEMFTFTDSFYSLFRTNAAAEGGYQMSPARYAERFIPSAHREVVAAETEAALNSANPDYHRMIVHPVVFADGSPGWIQVNFRLVLDPEGNPLRIIGVNQDISARKEAEKVQASLAALVANSEDIIVVKDRNRRVLATNKAFVQAAGRSSVEEMIGKTDAEIFGMSEDEEPLRTYKADDLQAMQLMPGEHIDREEPVIFPNGEVRTFLTRKFSVRDECGKVFAMGIVSSDITERKQAEDRLLKSEELFRSLVNGAPEGIFVQAKERFLFLNPTMVRLFGLKNAEEIIGTDLMARMAPEYHEVIRERIRFQEETKKTSELMDQAFLRLDGSKVPVETTAVPIRFKDQDAHLVFVRDISERKAIQDQRETQLNFSKALNKISETIILSDQPNHILTVSNQIIGETLAVDRTLIYRISFKDDYLIGLCEWLRQRDPDIQTTIGKYPLQLFRAPFTEIKKTQQYLESHCSAVGAPFLLDGSGEMLHGRFKIKSLIWYPFAFEQDGFHVFTINQILEQRQWSNDEIIFLESVAKLVSIALMKNKLLDERERLNEEQQKLQEQLLQSQKMETVGRLAGGVAHDFNNMLSLIIGYADMALEELDPALPIFTQLQEIKDAGERSADLTRQLLAFARKQTISPKVLDINSNVEEIMKMLQRLIGEDIHLEWVPGKNLWPVKMDPSQINQIMTNLCVNAKDAIDNVGKISIETENTVLDDSYCTRHPEFVVGHYVVLSVSDNGCGMEYETLQSVFEPFFTTKEKGKGTGLGLAMVYGVVKQNKGFITVHSDPGKGTTFKIYIPRHRAKSVFLPEQSKKQKITRGNETILLVEDEPTILKMTTMMLERQGYKVLAAKNPGEAIRVSRGYPDVIHMLLTDVVMPEMNGRDLAENIQHLYPDLSCLFMSGYTADVIAHHGVLNEGVNFIQKPFTQEQLGAKLRETLDKDKG